MRFGLVVSSCLVLACGPSTAPDDGVGYTSGSSGEPDDITSAAPDDDPSAPASGTTSDPTRGNDGGAEPGEPPPDCGTTHLMDIEETCQGLGTPSSMIDNLFGERAMTLEWYDDDGEGIEFVTPDSPTGATWLLRYEGDGDPHCAHPCARTGTPGSIVVNARLDLVTSDGTLVIEDLPVRAFGDKGPFMVRVTGSLTPADVGGTVNIDILDPDYRSPRLRVDANLTLDGFTGTLIVDADDPGAEGGSAKHWLATWGG